MPVYTTASACTKTPVYTAVLVHTTGAACTTAHSEHLRHNASAHHEGPAGTQIWKIPGDPNVSTSI
eukprot:7646966-Pyramimonas_sp.AAC.1